MLSIACLRWILTLFKYTVQDEARKNHSPFSRESLELLLVFYLDLLILSILGLPVSSLLAGADCWYVGMGSGLPIWSMVSLSF